jgi:hypothetical protein
MAGDLKPHLYHLWIGPPFWVSQTWLARQLDYRQQVLHRIDAQLVNVRVARYLVAHN